MKQEKQKSLSDLPSAIEFAIWLLFTNFMVK